MNDGSKEESRSCITERNPELEVVFIFFFNHYSTGFLYGKLYFIRDNKNDKNN
jgi:hypothetical protein